MYCRVGCIVFIKGENKKSFAQVQWQLSQLLCLEWQAHFECWQSSGSGRYFEQINCASTFVRINGIYGDYWCTKGPAPWTPAPVESMGHCPKPPLHIRNRIYPDYLSTMGLHPKPPCITDSDLGYPQTMSHNFSYFPVPFPDCRALLSCHSTQYFTKHPQTL